MRGPALDPAATAEYGRVILDTAPTGHTLRLMTLPGAWSRFLETATAGTAGQLAEDLARTGRGMIMSMGKKRRMAALFGGMVCAMASPPLAEI